MNKKERKNKDTGKETCWEKIKRKGNKIEGGKGRRKEEEEEELKYFAKETGSEMKEKRTELAGKRKVAKNREL